MTNSYIAPVEADSNGELILVLPDELMEEMKWNVGDQLVWSKNEDNTWTLRVDEVSDT